MNADISYNSRVANQASLQKGKVYEEVEALCEKLQVQVPTVHTSDVDSQLSENNTWIAVLAEKLRRINIAVDALETA